MTLWSHRSVGLLVLALAAGCSGNARQPVPEAKNSEWMIFIGRGIPEELRTEVGNELQTLIGKDSISGDIVTVISAPAHDPIASLVVPSGSPNTRLKSRSIQREIASLRRMLTSKEREAGSGQIQLPTLPATVRSLRRSTFPCRIIVVGNVLYDDPRHPGWRMTEGAVPSHGALDAKQSPFKVGTQLPEGTVARWLSTNKAVDADPRHIEEASAFNRLFLQERGGRLAAVTPTPAMAFDFDNLGDMERIVKRVEAARMKPVSFKSVASKQDTATPEVIVPKEEPVSHESPSISETATEQVRPTPPVPTPLPQASAAAAEQVLREAVADKESIAIAINWESADPTCDLDLYISLRGHAEEMSYKQKITSFGELYRDVTKSGSVGGANVDFSGWEWARIDHNRLSDLTVWVHTYRASKAMTLRVVYVANGIRKEQTLKLAPRTSWTGWLASSREQDGGWKKLTLQ